MNTRTSWAVGSDRLARVHAKANVTKSECYFVGFVEGILANRRVDTTEVEPLIAECEAFCRHFGDEDASEIIAESKLDYADSAAEIFDLLTCISEYRARSIDAECERSASNRLMGFCAGVACDGIITVREASTLRERLDETHELSADPRILSLRTAVEDALQDGVVDVQEASSIAGWITKLVGESYSDTGIASLDAPAVLEDLSDVPDADFLQGATVVLTGKFESGARSEIIARLTALGARTSASVTRKCDLLVIGSQLSRDWKFAHCGIKVEAALKLRSAGEGPRIVSELQIASLLQRKA